MQGLHSCLRRISWAEQWRERRPRVQRSRAHPWAPSSQSSTPVQKGRRLWHLLWGEKYNCYVEGIGMAKQREEHSQDWKRGLTYACGYRAKPRWGRLTGIAEPPPSSSSLLLQLLITAELTLPAPSLPYLASIQPPLCLQSALSKTQISSLCLLAQNPSWVHVVVTPASHYDREWPLWWESVLGDKCVKRTPVGQLWLSLTTSFSPSSRAPAAVQREMPPRSLWGSWAEGRPSVVNGREVLPGSLLSQGSPAGLGDTQLAVTQLSPLWTGGHFS